MLFRKNLVNYNKIYNGFIMKKEIYTSKLKAGSRTYFFDVKESSIGKLYLEITESSKQSDGSYKRHNIMIFNDDIKNFKNELIEIYQKYFEQPQ